MTLVHHFESFEEIGERTLCSMSWTNGQMSVDTVMVMHSIALLV